MDGTGTRVEHMVRPLVVLESSADFASSRRPSQGWNAGIETVDPVTLDGVGPGEYWNLKG